jgi:hypothetical protein
MFGNSGIARLKAQMGSDQEQEERDRHVPPTVLEGEDQPSLNPDGSADFPILADDADIKEQPDGSALIKLDVEGEAADTEFDDNLAETLEDSVLSKLARDLLDAIERDKEARKKRDEQYAEGIRRTGLGNEAPGGATFEGASRAVHPVLVEACIDFAARAIKELLPAEGPVKTRIIGEQTEAKLQKADRKRQYMNWQITSQMPEYKREHEVALTQLPLGGSQYIKFRWDERWKRVRCEFVPIDDVLLPFEATDLYSSQRVTHVQRLNRATFEERRDSGVYADIGSFGDTADSPDQTDSARAAATVEGVEDLSYNEDGLRTVYESQVLLTLDEGVDPLAKRPLMPYVLTVDDSTGKVLALRRNWDEEDEDKCAPLEWMVELPFIPWRGAYAIGLSHVIGSLSGATTGALRALLDSALINSLPTAFSLKGARMAGQNTKAEPGQINPIEGPTSTTDIRQLLMPAPFNPPSQVLFDLLQWLTQQAKGVVATASEKIADATSTMPVGTALALIEQGSITFSSIHSRLHAAQKRELAIIHRLNAKYLSDQETVDELGELVVGRADFQGPMDVEPVSDPNIFSDAQRYAQMQALLQLQASAPQLYDAAHVHRRAVRTLKLDPDELLNVPKEPQRIDAVSENKKAVDPKVTLKAYPEQDHLAHLQSHVAFMTSPMFGANPLIGAPALPKLLMHCREHILELYQQHAQAAMAAAQAMQTPSGDSEVIAEQEIAKLLAPLMPHLAQAQQLAQQFNPPPPGDPKLAIAQMKQSTDAQKLALDKAQFDAEQQQAQAKQALDAATAQAEQRHNELKLMYDKSQQDEANRLEAWQTQFEMSTADRNASLAAISEENRRHQELLMQHLGGQQAEQLAVLQGHIDAQLLAIREQAANERAQAEAREAEQKFAEGGSVQAEPSAVEQALSQIAQQLAQRRKFVAKRDANGDLMGLYEE